MKFKRSSALLICASSILFQACEGHGSSTGASRLDGGQAPADATKVALKFVEYTDASGKPVITPEEASKLTREMNEVLYPQCGIYFVAEEHLAVDPAKQGLAFNTSSMSELNPIRSKFQDPSRLVVVNTGAWDHGGMGSANAWTTMPGEPLAGAVIEEKVAKFANIVAHELGHYLGLDHEADTGNLMNPVIYDTSTRLDSQQCETMKQVAKSHWGGSLR